MLAEKVEELTTQVEKFTTGDFEVPGTGRTALEIASEHDRIFQGQDTIQADIEEISTVLLGTRASDLMGGGRYDDGLKHKVENIEHQLGNGGVRIRLPWSAWVAIWIAIISGAAQVVSAAIG